MSVAGPLSVLPPPAVPETSSRHLYIPGLSSNVRRFTPFAAEELLKRQSTRPDTPPLVERRMGDTETSYFFSSRESGVNDMYLLLSCHAPPKLFSPQRVRLVWAILRTRHPLLASRVHMHNYTDIRFVYRPPRSVEDALRDAATNLKRRNKQTKDELLDSYLNGPRTLSADRISYLIISSEPQGTSIRIRNYNVLICAAHFIGDGMALHQFANDFFRLLGSPSTNDDLQSILSIEVQTRCSLRGEAMQLPAPLESRLPPVKGRFSQAVARVDFKISQEKLIGGQTFPRKSAGPRKTATLAFSVDEKTTKEILKRCKSRGVSISSALFALCNLAWAKTLAQNLEMPMMMYSALNLRPHLLAGPAINDSYWFLAIGYFNVILPSFPPRPEDESAAFWHRAHSAKKQCTRAAKNPMTVSRSREMARERGERARAWAKEDDERAAGTWVTPIPSSMKPTSTTNSRSDALIGLSLLGNLDGTYKHSSFGEISLHTLTTGSRQRAGGMLLFSFTFVGKLWILLGYDEHGFDRDVVEGYWRTLLGLVNDLLVV